MDFCAPQPTCHSAALYLTFLTTICNAKSIFIFTVQWLRYFGLIQKASVDIRHLVCPNVPRFIARIRANPRFSKRYWFIVQNAVFVGVPNRSFLVSFESASIDCVRSHQRLQFYP